MTNRKSRRTADEALEALRNWSASGSELERWIKSATAEKVINGHPDIFADERKAVHRRPTIRLEASICVILGQGFMLAASGIVFGGALKLLLQCVFWLQHGYWQPFSVQALLHDLGIEAPKTPQLLGLQKIIDAVMSWPAMICLVAAAGLCAFAGALLIGLGSVYLVEIEQKAEAAFLAQIAGELQEDRREKAEQSKKDFDFTDRIQQLHRDKGLSG